METYNKKQAAELGKEFIELHNVDLYATDRKTRNVVLRTLFYKVLRYKNNMNDREISDFFEENDTKKDRSSIYISFKKIDIYYETYDYFREAYDLYFKDKFKRHNKIKEKEIRMSEKLKKENDKVVPKIDKDELQAIIDTLKDNKRAEILELVRLRVKSWEWKVEDRCEVIEGYSSLI